MLLWKLKLVLQAKGFKFVVSCHWWNLCGLSANGPSASLWLVYFHHQQTLVCAKLSFDSYKQANDRSSSSSNNAPATLHALGLRSASFASLLWWHQATVLTPLKDSWCLPMVLSILHADHSRCSRFLCPWTEYHHPRRCVPYDIVTSANPKHKGL